MYGEVRCLMCARHLADVVDGGRGRPRLSPPAGQSAAPILVEPTLRGLRCRRCGGRAMVEPVVGREVLLPTAGPQAGAA